MRIMFVGWGVGFWIFCNTVYGQVDSFPYFEHFDSIADSTIPDGWGTTSNRRTGGDFFASLSTPHSSPHCLLSQNSTISQSLTSPSFDLSNRTPDQLQFYVARSSSHTAGLLVEASLDDGLSFTIPLSDTIKNPGTTGYVITVLQLPSSLMNAKQVRIRWRIVGGAGGSTGTFRIDDISLSTIISYDLAAAGLSIHPAIANSKDSLSLAACIRNLGTRNAANYTVNFYCDTDNDLLLEPGERFASIVGTSIAPGDSTMMIAGHSPMAAGSYKFFAITSLVGDEQGSNDTCSSLLTIGYPKGSILVNEFMYAPTGDEPEWVELFNCSIDTVNLKNWRISDNNVSSKSLITSSYVFLPPKGFCIVAKEASFSSYHPSVQCPVLVASFSALNNATPDAIVIYDQRSIAIDSVLYSPGWGGQRGNSLERVDIDQASTDLKNWGTSEDSSGSTPGRTNSIVRLDYDLSMGACYQSRIESVSGSVSVINCVVHNLGKHPVTSYTIDLFVDVNRDGYKGATELITSLDSKGTLNPSDSAIYAYSWLSPPQGESVIIANVEYSQDLRLGNNRSSLLFRDSYNSHCVVVNEIMYDPLINQSEWIELYNRGGDIVDLKGWKLEDRPTASGNVNFFTISSQPILLQRGTFAVVAADSTILTLFPYLASPISNCGVIILNEAGGFSLGNDGDDILLKDLTNTTIDSVSYSPRWHRPDVTDTKGRSLERINPDLDSNSPYNWTTSVLSSGGTPGKTNSSHIAGAQSGSSLSFSPNPFSPDGDGFEDFCIFQYRLPLAAALVHVKIFDLKGRLVRTLANSQISNSGGEIIWDGRDQARQRVRIGPYIVLVQATDPNGKSLALLKGVVVVATRM